MEKIKLKYNIFKEEYCLDYLDVNNKTILMLKFDNKYNIKYNDSDYRKTKMINRCLDYIQTRIKNIIDSNRKQIEVWLDIEDYLFYDFLNIIKAREIKDIWLRKDNENYKSGKYICCQNYNK